MGQCNLIKRVKYGLKIVFNKEFYNEKISINKKNTLLNQRMKNQNKKYQQKIPEEKKISYNQGFKDGETNTYFTLRKKFNKIIKQINSSCPEEIKDLEDILIYLNDFEKFKDIIALNYLPNYFTNYCIMNLKKNEKISNKIIKYLKEFDKKTIKKVKRGIYESLINFTLLVSNQKEFDNYGILDTSYLIGFRERRFQKLTNYKDLCNEINGLIIPFETIIEYIDVQDYKKKDINRKKQDIIRLLTTPNSILIPDLNSKRLLPEEINNKFINQKADLQIYHFLKKFGDQFENIHLLSNDNELRFECNNLLNKLRLHNCNYHEPNKFNDENNFYS